MNVTMTPFSSPFKLLVSPLLKFNQMMAEQMGRLLAVQMNSLRGYVDLGASQTLVGARVSDPSSLHEFVDTQLAVISFVNYRVIDDSRAVAEWGYECYTRSHCLAREHALEILFDR